MATKPILEPGAEPEVINARGKIDSGNQPVPWPDPPAPEAFLGLAGDVVRVIEPHSEADRVALLIQFLVAFGNVIGRAAHFVVEADRHFMNLFICLVGKTSKARKGTSWGRIRDVFEGVDVSWATGRVISGLSSGEGLIHHVRDPTLKHKPIRNKKQVVGSEQVIDPGIDDKRLLVMESEFSSVLRNTRREGNTLSPTVRAAWDGVKLQTLTKNSPEVATNTHVSIIGHITKDELLRHLDDTETANGFANRFLWICVQRSKFLPDGGSIDPSKLKGIKTRLDDAVRFGRKPQRLRRDKKASALWREVYPDLSEGRPGLLGAVISRAEAQVTRLSCIYALLDSSRVVRIEHLRAALALWKYAEASASYVFGNTLGDPLADEIVLALRNSPEGLTRTAIRDLFARNKYAGQINGALAVLLENGLAHSTEEETEGRPTTRWWATRPGTASDPVSNVRRTGKRR